MKQLNLTDVTKYVEDNIGVFHQKRIERLNRLKLKTVLKKKNPYLFKAKHILTASEIVQGIADAFISSAEETIFGDWLESLAIFINQKVYSGWKSGIPNIDLIGGCFSKWLLLRNRQQSRQRRLLQILWARILGIYFR